MKTIDEAAKEYAVMSDDKFANSAKKYDAFDLKQAFEHGVEFAQQFINVDKELPNKKLTNMSKIKEFDELDPQYYIDSYGIPDLVDLNGDTCNEDLRSAIMEAQKDAWNAAIRYASENCEFYCDKQLVLTQLIND